MGSIIEILGREGAQKRKVMRTCLSMAATIGRGPDMKPNRMPEERILDKLSNRTTRPTSD